MHASNNVQLLLKAAWLSIGLHSCCVRFAYNSGLSGLVYTEKHILQVDFFASDILVIATIQILAKCGVYFTIKLRQRKRPYNVRGSAAEDLWYFVFTISEMYL